MPEFAILCPSAFDYILNKTGNMLIRYRQYIFLAWTEVGEVDKIRSKWIQVNYLKYELKNTAF